MNDNFKIIETALDCVVNDIGFLIEQTDGKQKNHLRRALHLASDALLNVKYASSASPKRELEQWQKGVIADKNELDEKIEKMKQTLGNTISFIDTKDHTLMLQQYRTMQSYSDALKERIEGFGK